jgi:fibronectin-binding autotransporter adhesin
MNCTITSNRANYGAGIFASNDTLTIANSLISANTAFNLNASSGGGINFTVTKALKLTITNSTIDSNTALDGAGLVGDNSKSTSSRPSINISDSTISNNTATTEGAGVFVGDVKLTITDSTINANIVSAVSGSGGGLLTQTSNVTLNNVTIADNSSGGLGGGIFIDVDNLSFVFSNTIIADNHAVASLDCNAYARTPVTSHDYNFIGNLTGCTVLGKTTHNLTGDPKLGPLQNNGGTTLTQALLFGSPAAGTGNPATPNGLNSHCVAKDQIGTPRPKGQCDIGAYQIP